MKDFFFFFYLVLFLCHAQVPFSHLVFSIQWFELLFSFSFLSLIDVSFDFPTSPVLHQVFFLWLSSQRLLLVPVFVLFVFGGLLESLGVFIYNVIFRMFSSSLCFSLLFDHILIYFLLMHSSTIFQRLMSQENISVSGLFYHMRLKFDYTLSPSSTDIFLALGMRLYQRQTDCFTCAFEDL